MNFKVEPKLRSRNIMMIGSDRSAAFLTAAQSYPKSTNPIISERVCDHILYAYVENPSFQK